jgi:hypothetical protein
MIRVGLPIVRYGTKLTDVSEQVFFRLKKILINPLSD